MEKFKPKVKKDEYELDDAEYILVKAIIELTNQIKRLADK